MKELKRGLRLGLMISALVLVSGQVLQAGKPKGDVTQWENLHTLALGSTVRVVLKDSKSYTGKLQAVSRETLSIRTTRKEQPTFTRGNILRVSARRKSHRKRNLLIGLAVGGATGVIVGVASPELGQGTCEQGSCVNAGTVSLVTFGGAMAGMLVGALIPTGGWHEVYRQR